MHSTGKLVRNAAHNVAENCLSAVGVYLYVNDLLVLNAKLLRVGRGKVNVSLSNDNALFKLNLACGSNKLAACRACCVAAFADRRGNADRTSVRSGKLNLCCGTYRSEDRNVCERLFRSNDLNALLAGVLTGLGKVFFLSKGRALAEKGLQVLLCNVYVTCGSFNDKSF